jgi:hypothetical protein
LIFELYVFLIKNLIIGVIMMGKKRNFVLRDANGNELGIFSGRQPRQAALKAANRGYTDIKLRERGTNRVHIFQGERKQVAKPAGAPAWMPGKIWTPSVKKLGIEVLARAKSGYHGREPEIRKPEMRANHLARNKPKGHRGREPE